MAKKTDNHNPEAKLKLRRHFLEKYHADGSAKVFDCCQGGGVMWTALRLTHPVASYWGVDVKPKKGRVKIDSVRVLQQPGMKQDVIDIDTYGSPWKHWLALLPNVVRATTVFMTIGDAGGNQVSFSTEEFETLGFPQTARRMPGLLSRFRSLVMPAMLWRGNSFATIAEAVEVSSTGNARYIGVRLEPKENSPQSSPASCQHNSDRERIMSHV